VQPVGMLLTCTAVVICVMSVHLSSICMCSFSMCTFRQCIIDLTECGQPCSKSATHTDSLLVCLPQQQHPKLPPWVC
jgi:hypothetical protein